MSKDTVSLKRFLKLKIKSTKKDIRHLREVMNSHKELFTSGNKFIAKALKKQEAVTEKKFLDINPTLIAPIRKDLNEVITSQTQDVARERERRSKVFTISVVSAIIAFIGAVVATIALIKSLK